MSQSETESTKHALDADGGENQANLTSESSKPTVTTKKMMKKRKAMESRSPAWDHLEKVMEGKLPNDKLVGAKCIYCDKVLQVGSKKHGTSTLLNHSKSCLKNPHAQETKQALLSFSKSKDGKNEYVLGTWVFNQEVVRDALAKMLIMDELPFSFVEGWGFRYFVEKAVPRFQIPSRWTISRDIAYIFENGKKELQKEFKAHSQSVSLTTDTWTSIQRVNYMVITAHWIDDGCELKKKVISFVPIFSHKENEIAQVLERFLLEWGLRNIFIVTVDNASSNDVALAYLKRKLITWGSSSVKAKYLHMRCIAHILNLVVQDGLKLADSSVRKVRDCVRWMRNSPKRLSTFNKLKGLLGIEYEKSLSLDVPTRWNSTFLMLQTAPAYQKVFESYPTEDSSFTNDLGDSVPTCIKRMGWWKQNSHRFPVLSRMARNFLGVPISTVAYESTFSTGGRILDPFRSSLSSKAVEALIYVQDWLRGPSDPLQVEENFYDAEKFEEQLLQARGRGSTGRSSSTSVTVDVDS